MKKEDLIYILIGLIIVFLGLVGIVAWPKKENFIAKKVVSSSHDYKTTQYNVPILMYHYIRDDQNDTKLGQNLSVSPTNFSLQMKWLNENNYATLNLVDLADPSRKEISKIVAQKKKPIVLTFDDGYDNAYIKAWPILKENNFTGTFFIIRDFVGKPEYMSQTQINELQTAGMEIGAHTMSHHDLSKISVTDQRKQIFDSKISAQAFCYPSGKFNETTIALVKEAGYKLAVTTKPGIANENSNLFELPRVRVENGDGQYLRDQIKKANEHKNSF